MVAAATLAGATSFRSVADYIADLPPEALRATRRPPAPAHPPVRGAERADDPARRDLRRRGRGGRLGRALAGRAGARRAARRQGGPDLHRARAGRQDAQRLLGRGEHRQREGPAVLRARAPRGGCRRLSAPSPRTPTSSPEVVPLLAAVAGHRTEDGNGDLTGTVITAAALPVPDPIGIGSPPVSMARTCRACAGVSAERRHQGLWCLVRPS
jgi:hypothetical protein